MIFQQSANANCNLPSRISKAIYLKAYASMAEVKQGLAGYFKLYNDKRWHNSFDRKTPRMGYCDTLSQDQAAA